VVRSDRRKRIQAGSKRSAPSRTSR